MSFTKKTIRRALEAVPTLFGLSVLMFLLTRLVPGDPVRASLGPYATQEQVQNLRAELGFDQPLHVQYVDWLVGITQLDWGRSLRTERNVYVDIADTLTATLELVFVAILLAVLLAVPLGIVAARNKDRLPDHLSRLGALAGVSMPKFWLGIVLQILLAVYLGILPLSGRLAGEEPPGVTGFYLVDSALALNPAMFVDAFTHLLMPAFVLGVGTLAQVMRLVRSDMIEVSREDYIMSARAYGLPQDLITYKYMLKNAFTNSLTVIGLAFGILLGNAFVVELVFAWPGMARYGVRAIQFQDFNAIMGVVMVIGVTYLTINFLVDILYTYLDPRLRLEGK